WTQQGIEKVKESPARIDAVRKLFKEMGGEAKEFYVVMGRYDGVVIAEAPNDETAAKIALALGSKGSARSETLRAFSEDEFRKIVIALP
ncbi:MAG TPA: GYD domain-containing protein, partial [Blastocatellia bacterium]|nr:GYD domain-containing protein [Blastocatellia bacterium]